MNPKPRQLPSDADLDRMQLAADPPADDTIHAILGAWPQQWGTFPSASAATTANPATAHNIGRIKELDAILRTWVSNKSVAEWRANAAQNASGIGPPLEKFVAVAAQPLPDWVDRDRLARAETMFMGSGALSVTILFCASLPECYVVPDLAAVLHSTGQLVHNVDYRIRSTGAIVFPAMMIGGLTQDHGSGAAQVLKVRLIHAVVRNLILRGPPAPRVQALVAGPGAADSVLVPPLAPIRPNDDKHAALYVHGWDVRKCGIPDNQEELAYTLLTFSYVYLRSMRRLGIAFNLEQEKDYLHLWNVVGHILGIRRELTVDTMEDAEKLFARMQERGRKEWGNHAGDRDPRPELGHALMNAMEIAIPAGTYRPFPTLMARELIEPQSVRDLGLDRRPVPPESEKRFAQLLGAARYIDSKVRRVFPDFSLCRLMTRVIGYRLTCVLLMSQTRELELPRALHGQVESVVGDWGRDPQAGSVMNGLEDLLTTWKRWTPLKPPKA